MASVDDQVKSDKTVQGDTTNEDDIPFTVEKKCDDEVVLLFDDGQKLFVSRNFLSLASPVFLKMFTLDFEEKQTGTVKLKGKKYDEMLEFLLYLHPNESRQISDDNVFRILGLAEEYGNNKTIQECKEKLSEITDNKFDIVANKTNEIKRTEALTTMLKLLSVAILYGYDVQAEKLINSLGRIGTHIYTHPNINVGIKSNFEDNTWIRPETQLIKSREDCKAEYEALPDKIKVKILNKRLLNIENSKII